jgi:hypothetical protein
MLISLARALPAGVSRSMPSPVGGFHFACQLSKSPRYLGTLSPRVARFGLLPVISSITRTSSRAP